MSEDSEEDLFDYVRSELAVYRQRVGAFAFDVVESAMGRRGAYSYFRDGDRQENMRVPWTLVEHRDWAHGVHGRPWFTSRVQVSPDGGCTFSFEYDLPPEAPQLRTVGDIADDVALFPRSPELVPGWMKVELALVGAWDLATDQLTVNDRWEPIGTPQTAASVGVPLPPGAEHAWSEDVFGGTGPR